MEELTFDEKQRALRAGMTVFNDSETQILLRRLYKYTTPAKALLWADKCIYEALELNSYLLVLMRARECRVARLMLEREIDRMKGIRKC